MEKAQVKYGPPDPPEDLSVMEVNALIHWAEQMTYTTGLVHGDRRKAAGIELIRRGIQVLRARVRTPDDMGDGLREVSAKELEYIPNHER